jgi:hypothetical protein
MTSSASTTVRLDVLERLVDGALRRQGYTDDKERAIIADVLLYAQIRGSNQGVVKLIDGRFANKQLAPLQVVRETSVSALINGNQTQGMVSQRERLSCFSQEEFVACC